MYSFLSLSLSLAPSLSCLSLGIVGIGEKHGIWEAFLFAPLAVDGCSFHDPRWFEPQKNWKLIEYASSAVLEETLRCDGVRMGKALDAIETEFDFVAQFEQKLV